MKNISYDLLKINQYAVFPYERLPNHNSKPQKASVTRLRGE